MNINERADAASESVKTSWGQFSDRFAFLFRRIRDDDGITEWRKLVDQCDIALLLEVLELTAENWNHERGIPKGNQIRKAYRELWETRNHAKVEEFRCHKCENSGALWIVYYELGHKEGTCEGGLLKNVNGMKSCLLHPSCKIPLSKNRLKTSPVPCVCSHGKKYGVCKEESLINIPDADYSTWSHKGQLEAFDWIDTINTLFRQLPTKPINKMESAP